MLGLQILHTLLSHPNVNVAVVDGDRRQPLLWAASAGSAKAVLALVIKPSQTYSYDVQNSFDNLGTSRCCSTSFR